LLRAYGGRFADRDEPEVEAAVTTSTFFQTILLLFWTFA